MSDAVLAALISAGFSAVAAITVAIINKRSATSHQKAAKIKKEEELKEPLNQERSKNLSDPKVVIVRRWSDTVVIILGAFLIVFAPLTLYFSEARIDNINGILAKTKNQVAEINELKFKAQLPVGSIVISYLAPVDFIKPEFLGIWVPADGRMVDQNWLYAQLSSNPAHLPDLRGMFLRGKNEFDQHQGLRSDRWADPGPRDSDGYQNDDVAPHTHRIPTTHKSGSHGPATTLQMTGGAYGFDPSGPGPGKETRPKNLAVYYYVKVN